MIASLPNDNVRVRTLLKLSLTRKNDAGNEENEAYGTAQERCHRLSNVTIVRCIV